jgi:hypothetical protein
MIWFECVIRPQLMRKVQPSECFEARKRAEPPFLEPAEKRVADDWKPS